MRSLPLLVFLLILMFTRLAKANDNVKACIGYIDDHKFNVLISHPEYGEEHPMLTAPISHSRVVAYCKCMAGKLEVNHILVDIDTFECGAISRIFELSTM